MLALFPSVGCNLIGSAPLVKLLLAIANTSLYVIVVRTRRKNPICIQVIYIDDLCEKRYQPSLAENKSAFLNCSISPWYKTFSGTLFRLDQQHQTITNLCQSIPEASPSNSQ